MEWNPTNRLIDARDAFVHEAMRRVHSRIERIGSVRSIDRLQAVVVPGEYEISDDWIMDG